MAVEPYGLRTLDHSLFGVKNFMDGGSFPEFFVYQQPKGPRSCLLQDPSQEYERVTLKRKERSSLKPDSFSEDPALDSNTRPGHKSVEASKERTLKGIEFRLGSGLKVAGSKKDLKRNDPSYVKYSVFGSEGSAKVIRMQEVPLDPLEPSKFRHKKVPRSSSSAVPEAIHHSPERESKSIPEEWVIPASISNWKNPKGYTIPLDKRLAADGRNLNSLQINDKFANLSEALYLAEHKARQAVETRANIQKELLVKQKEKMESDLRTLARIAKKKKEE